MAERTDAKTIDNNTLKLVRAIAAAFSKCPISSTAAPLIIFWTVTRPAPQLGVRIGSKNLKNRKITLIIGKLLCLQINSNVYISSE